jgi:hypothetical protein
MLAVAAGAFLMFGPKLPREQSVRIGLGDRAGEVRELVLRYRPTAAAGEADKGDLTDEVLREVSFRYPKGEAPRVVRHAPRLADGDYVLEIEVVTHGSRASVKRTVGLFGGSTTVDIASVIPAPSPEPTSADAGGAR